MSGHSKWNNIKARKGKQDAVRGKIFTKLGREISVAVKQGGPDPESNATLATAISKAKANNMPNDTIKNAIKKASGEGNTENYEEIVYEGYGKFGVALVVEAMTDNKNRTAGEVRHAFDRNGGNLGTTGSVTYMFNKKGQIIIGKENLAYTDDEVMEIVIEAGAEDMLIEDEYLEVICEPRDFANILKALEEKGIKMEQAEIVQLAETKISLTEEQYEKIENLVEKLEELDDVQNVYHNAEEA